MKKSGVPHEASHSVTLSETDRASLQTFIHAGKASARTFTRAHILLKAVEGWTDTQICEALDVTQYLHPRAPIVPRSRCRGGTVRQATSTSPRGSDRRPGGASGCHRLHTSTPRPRPLDNAAARRQGSRTGFCQIDLARNHSPTAQKNELKPWQHEQWCIPNVEAEFVSPMEDVLDLYEEDYDPCAGYLGHLFIKIGDVCQENRERASLCSMRM
jgi:hypothetical protein